MRGRRKQVYRLGIRRPRLAVGIERASITAKESKDCSRRLAKHALVESNQRVKTHCSGMQRLSGQVSGWPNREC